MRGVGDTLGPYKLVKRLAGGGMGEVFLASTQSELGLEVRVALKVLRSELASDSDFVQMMIDEARITMALSHQNIVSVLDFAQEGGDYYLAMEYVQGTTLERLMDAQSKQRRQPDLAIALFVGSELCSALKYAHGCVNSLGQSLNLVHRDVTPSNVLTSIHGEVKLTDFGIARAKGRIHETQAGVVKGRFGFLAPEVSRGEDIDGRADIFSAGIVLYQLVTGQHPIPNASVMEAIYRFEEKQYAPPAQLNPRLPKALSQAIMRALEPEPTARFATAEQLGAALENVVAKDQELRRTVPRGRDALSTLMRELYPEVFEDPSRPSAAPAERGKTDWVETPERSRLAGNVPTGFKSGSSGVTSEQYDGPQYGGSADLIGSGDFSESTALDPAALGEGGSSSGFGEATAVGMSALDDPSDRSTSGSGLHVAAEPNGAVVPFADAEATTPYFGGVPPLGAGQASQDLSTRPGIIESVPGNTAAERRPSAGGFDSSTAKQDALDEPSNAPYDGGFGGKTEAFVTYADPQTGLTEKAASEAGALADPRSSRSTVDAKPRTASRLVAPEAPVEPDPRASATSRSVSRSISQEKKREAEKGATRAPSGVPRPSATAASVPATSVGDDDDLARLIVETRNAAAGASQKEQPSPAEGSGGREGARPAKAKNWTLGGSRAAPPASDGGRPGSASMPAARYLGPLDPDLPPEAGQNTAAEADSAEGDAPRPTGRRGLKTLLATAAALVVVAGVGVAVMLSPKLGKARVQIASIPPGASVTLNGMRLNELTPTSVEVERNRPYKIEVGQDGYASEVREVTVSEEREVPVSVQLRKITYKVQIAPVRAMVYVNDKWVGDGQVVTLEGLDGAKPVDLRVEADGYLPHRLHFEKASRMPPVIIVQLILARAGQ